jgi:hypothetical protein
MSEVGASTCASLVVIDGFFPEELPTGMRADIKDHFAEPRQESQRPASLELLFVPRLYTYLRTAPQKVIHGDRVAGFHSALQAFR